MSKIALEGNASGTGTFTIAAPNSNSNYTLTLPTSTGTVVVTGGAQTIEFAAGSASTPSITFTGDTNTGIFSPAADTIAFSEGGVESMRINSSGNVRIGTTATLASYKLATSGLNIAFEPTNGNTDIEILLGQGTTTTGSSAGSGRTSKINCAFEGSNDNFYQSFGYVTTTANQTRINSASDFFIETKKAGDSSPAERMRIDSSGNVGISNTSPSTFGKVAINVAGTTTPTNATNVGPSSINLYSITNGGSTDCTTGIFGWNSGNPGIGAGIGFSRESSSDWGTQIRFYTHPTTTTNISDITERARIYASGYTALCSTVDGFHVASTQASGTTYFLIRGASAGTAGTPNSGTDRFFVFTNGNVTNSNGSYGTISDLKMKQDVVDASSQWDDIKSLRFCKYRLKADVELDPNTKPLLGLIAQEVEAVSPGLIDEHPDTKQEIKTREVEKTREVTPAVLDEEGNVVEPAVTETYTETEEYTEIVDLGTTTKSIKTSVLYMKAVKALQEAMERIETLEAEVAALKAKE